MDWIVQDNADSGRYEITQRDAVGGYIEYQLRDGVITFLHTEVDSTYKGQGLGSTLARDVLDDVRSRGLAVVPKCPFLAGYIRRHDEYADLVPAERRAEFGLA